MNYSHQYEALRQRTESTTDVANTILTQLGGAHRLRAMLGVKNFMADINALSFRFKNPGSGLPNHVEIKLVDSDTYTVTFRRFRGLNHKVLSTHKDVYVEDLRKLFETKTKLRLSL